MTDPEISTLHRRYVDLAGRFKAAWTFHQFLEGIRKYFAEAEIGPAPEGFQEVHGLLKTVADGLTGPASDRLAIQIEQASLKLDQVVAALAASDDRLAPPLVRQFFERVKNFDDQILTQMVRFYLALAAEKGLSGDRLDKVDYLVTKLSEETLPTGGFVLRDPTRLRELYAGFWASLEGLAPEPGWIEARRTQMAEIRRELGGVGDLGELTQNRLVAQYRDLKWTLGRFLMHPDILTAVVETNLALKNKVRQHFHLEEQRILSESQRIFELESQVMMDSQLDHQLSEFRRTFEDFEKKQRSANVKLDDLEFLKRQVEELMPRLTKPTVAAASAGPRSLPQADESPASAMPALATGKALGNHYEEILENLGGTDKHAPAKTVALSREIYHLRLEPREVTAYRRLHVAPEGDEELERFLLEAAALRLRINQEAAEITELLDESAVTKDAPVFGRARSTTKVADAYVQRFGAYVDAAIQDGAFGEAQQLQLLRMRLIRDYSGLWLLVNRPSS